MEPLALAGAALVAAGTVAWEVLLHRRTQAFVTAEIKRAEAKAQKDRDGILSKIEAIEARPVPAAPDPEAIAAHIVSALQAEAPERGRHFDDPERAREAREVREEKADLAAVAETDILALLTEQVGDTLAPAVMEYVRANAPTAWKRALANPKLAARVISPFIAVAKKMVAGAQKGGGHHDMR